MIEEYAGGCTYGGKYSELIYCAAVEKIEEMREPEDFFGHRKRALLGNLKMLKKNTSTSLAGGCHFTGIALFSSLTRQTRKYDLPTA